MNIRILTKRNTSSNFTLEKFNCRGDFSQSIYSWRSATTGNAAKENFPNLTIINLNKIIAQPKIF
jgi:superfamily I DNA/RNA helicase